MSIELHAPVCVSERESTCLRNPIYLSSIYVGHFGRCTGMQCLLVFCLIVVQVYEAKDAHTFVHLSLHFVHSSIPPPLSPHVTDNMQWCTRHC